MNATNTDPRTLLALVDLVRRSDFKDTLAAYAMQARARLASDPTAAFSWSALSSRSLPKDLPEGVQSAWVFVVRRGRTAGCHMHPTSTQTTISLEGRGTVYVGEPGNARGVALTADERASADERGVAIAPGTYHDAVAADNEWVVVSFHTASAQGLTEVGYGSTEGTSEGFPYTAHEDAGVQATEGGIRIDARCRRDSAPFPRVPEPNEFGRVFTANMFRMRYTKERGWSDAIIVPLSNLSLHPATAALHYGQEIFEGLKAFRQADGGVAIFRPDAHARRMVQSCERMAMPAVPPEMFVAACKALVALDQGKLPADPNASIYIRPLLFGSDAGLGVHAASEYLFLIFLCIVGRYYGSGVQPMKVEVVRDFVRAARGGTGAAKAGGNYAGSLVAMGRARSRGFDQVLWLDAHDHRFVEELGAMNFFAVYGKTLVTPPLAGTILPGVTRDSILQIAPSLGYAVEERPIAIEDALRDAERGTLTEAFAAGTAAVVTPVGEVSDEGRTVRIGGGEPGPVAMDLYKTLGALRTGRMADERGWLVRV
jgi:branched-chain amino acid aminotransferase